MPQWSSTSASKLLKERVPALTARIDKYEETYAATTPAAVDAVLVEIEERIAALWNE